MRYQGTLEDVKAIEKEITNNCNVKSIKRPPDYALLFGVKSSVITRKLSVFIHQRKSYFVAKFLYDEREDGKSVLEVGDRDIGLLFYASPNMNKLLAKLESLAETEVCSECGSRDVTIHSGRWICNECGSDKAHTRWTVPAIVRNG